MWHKVNILMHYERIWIGFLSCRPVVPGLKYLVWPVEVMSQHSPSYRGVLTHDFPRDINSEKHTALSSIWA